MNATADDDDKPELPHEQMPAGHERFETNFQFAQLIGEQMKSDPMFAILLDCAHTIVNTAHSHRRLVTPAVTDYGSKTRLGDDGGVAVHGSQPTGDRPTEELEAEHGELAVARLRANRQAFESLREAWFKYHLNLDEIGPVEYHRLASGGLGMPELLDAAAEFEEWAALILDALSPTFDPDDEDGDDDVDVSGWI